MVDGGRQGRVGVLDGCGPPANEFAGSSGKHVENVLWPRAAQAGWPAVGCESSTTDDAEGMAVMPIARLIKDDLWELRPGPYRVFYFIVSGRRCIILDGYRKKGNKAPVKQVARALRYMTDWRERETG